MVNEKRTPDSTWISDTNYSKARARPTRSTLEQLGYTGRWGHLGAAPMLMLQQLHDQFFFMKRALPLPSSFLVDANGHLAVVYRGPVSVDQLLSDVKLASDVTLEANSYEQTMQRAACLPGSVIEHPLVKSVAQRADRQTRYRVAAWLEKTHRYDDARRNFRELSEIDLQWALPHRHLAKLYLQRRELTEANRMALRSLELDPENAGAHNTMGLVLSELGSPRSAETHLRKSIDLDADFAEAHNNLGSILAAQGKMEAARGCFQRALRIDDQFVEAHINLGSVLAAKNDISRAIDHYQRAIDIDPNSVDAHNNLGTMHACQGSLQRAIREYQLVLRLDPNNRGALRNLNLARQRYQERKSKRRSRR